MVYCRVSWKSQLEWWGLTSQETRCKEFANYSWYKVSKVFRDEWVSWWLLERPGIKDLFQYVDTYNKQNTEKIWIFLCDDIDRIARDYEVHLELKKMMYRRDMRFETVNQKFEETPIWRFIEWIFALKSELFREENTHRVITRQEARLMDGYRPFDYPIGYKTVKAPVWGRLMVRDDPDASIIQEALENYAYGVLDTQNEVAQFLERKGLIIKRRAKNRTKNGMSVIHHSFVGRMLTNILYAGYIDYTKTTRDRKTGLIKKAWHISLRKAKHEGLISLETYYKIQERMKKKAPYKIQIKKVHEDFPLRWFLFCDCCGLPLSSWTSRKKPGKGWKNILYYSFNKKCTYKGKCLNAERLHSKFDWYMDGLKMDENYLDFLFHIIKEEYTARQWDKELVTRNIEKEIIEVERNIENVLNSITVSQSEIVRKKFENKIEELEMTRQNLKSQLSRDKWPKFDTILNIALDICKDPLSIRKQGTIDEKRLFLKLVFRNNLQANKKLEDFWTLPISALFALKRAYLMTDLPTFGDDGNRTRV